MAIINSHNSKIFVVLNKLIYQLSCARRLILEKNGLWSPTDQLSPNVAIWSRSGRRDEDDGVYRASVGRPRRPRTCRRILRPARTRSRLYCPRRWWLHQRKRFVRLMKFFTIKVVGSNLTKTTKIIFCKAEIEESQHEY